MVEKQEDTLKFWIIPIACFAMVGIFFAFSLEHKFNVVMPNAVLEVEEMKNMSCKQIKEKDSRGSYWTPENSALGREMNSNCTDIIKAESKRIRDLEYQESKINSLLQK